MIRYYEIKAVDASDAVEPVTLDEAKTFMEVDYDDKNVLISSLIKGSRKAIQRRLNKVLVKSVVTLKVKTTCALQPIDLAYYSNPSGLAVSDLEGDSLTLGTDEYKVFGSQVSIGYRGLFGLTWTETPAVDEDIKEAIMMLVAYRFSNRGDQEKQTGIPADIDAIIDQYRTIVL